MHRNKGKASPSKELATRPASTQETNLRTPGTVHSGGTWKDKTIACLVRSLRRLGPPYLSRSRSRGTGDILTGVPILTDLNSAYQTIEPLWCIECGGDPEICEEVGSHVWVTCSQCGAEMRPSFKFCHDCGNDL